MFEAQQRQELLLYTVLIAVTGGLTLVVLILLVCFCVQQVRSEEAEEQMAQKGRYKFPLADAKNARFSVQYRNLFHAAGPNLVQVTEADEEGESMRAVSFADKVRLVAPIKEEGVELINVLPM